VCWLKKKTKKKSVHRTVEACLHCLKKIKCLMAPLFTTVASFHRAESRQELLLIFSRFKRCSTWDPVNSNSRLCVTKQLVASNRRKRGRHHVAKRSLSPYSLLLSTSTVYDTMLSNPSMGYIYGIVYIFF